MLSKTLILRKNGCSVDDDDSVVLLIEYGWRVEDNSTHHHDSLLLLTWRCMDDGQWRLDNKSSLSDMWP